MGRSLAAPRTLQESFPLLLHCAWSRLGSQDTSGVVSTPPSLRLESPWLPGHFRSRFHSSFTAPGVALAPRTLQESFPLLLHCAWSRLGSQDTSGVVSTPPSLRLESPWLPGHFRSRFHSSFTAPGVALAPRTLQESFPLLLHCAWSRLGSQDTSG